LINSEPLSISNLKLDLKGFGQPRMALEKDFLDLVKKFSDSARIAKQCGFDGVEIHAAHGYLLSSSLSPRINNRSDKWGGSFENRARFLQLILKKVRATVGKSFIIAVKLNSSDFQKGGLEISDSVKIAQLIEKENIDFIEVSGGNFEVPKAYQYISLKESTKNREAYFLEYAKSIKTAVSIPIMVTGGFRSKSVMEDALMSSSTDLIGIGRPFIIDPYFPKKLLSGDILELPTIERQFPSSQDIPNGAVLNWFCDQLALQGKTGKGDLNITLLDGHKRYLKQSDEMTRNLLDHRNNKK
jgi:2,4-dienoyl-CoA reductase-like NADH-dependent reductase (Old Yellow Enzyme family)